MNLAGSPQHRGKLEELRARCQEAVTAAKGDVNTSPATVRMLPSRGTGGKAGKKAR